MCSSLLTSLWRETVDLEEERYPGVCLNWTFKSTGSDAVYRYTRTKHAMFTELHNVFSYKLYPVTQPHPL